MCSTFSTGHQGRLLLTAFITIVASSWWTVVEMVGDNEKRGHWVLKGAVPWMGGGGGGAMFRHKRTVPLIKHV